MRRLLGLLALPACLVGSVAVAHAGSHSLVYTIDGDSAGERLGFAVSEAGDVDGDGYDDILVGSYMDTNDNGSEAGRAQVCSGKDGRTIHTFYGDAAGDRFGVSVSGVGDVNKDGYDDVVVGAYLADANGADSGMARVFSGKDGKAIYTFRGDSAGDSFGVHVSGAGDVNKDGYPDIVIGAYNDDNNGTDSGSARVFSGKDGEILHTFNGDSADDRFGRGADGAGDVNDDGYDDLIVGAYYDDPNGTNSGSARVFSGKDGSTLHSFSGKSADSRFGFSVSGLGDVNRDGHDDVVVAAFYDDANGTNSGTVWVHSGKDGKVLYTFYGDASDDRLGVFVRRAGDVDGDAYPDLIAGAYFDDENGANCGSVRVYSGKDGKVLYTFYGDSQDDNFGRFVSGAGDVNGDGLDDFIVGAHGDDCNATDCGRAYVYASPVPSGTVTIESGAEATNDTSVTLSLTWKAAPAGGAVTDMRFRNAGESWGSWTEVAATAPWTLPSVNGEKEVEAQFLDAEDAISVVVSDTVFLDQTKPTGSIVVEGGADWVFTTDVTVELFYADQESGVVQMRLRNEDSPWSPWQTAASSETWAISPGDGWKTVGAQFRDAAGNVSDVAEDTVGIDTTPPVVTVLMEEGAAFTAGRDVTLTIQASDGGGSGVVDMRLRSETATFWYDWIPYVETFEWPISAGDGEKGVVVQVRDRAGNVSEVEDTIVLDEAGPEIESVLVNEGRPYVLPHEGLTMVVKARDGIGGSGVSDFKASFDGSTFSAWYPLLSESPVDVARPDTDGLFTVTVVVRDRLGNESAPADASVYLVEREVPSLGAGAKFGGSISGATDVDATELHLVKGDLLTVKAKTKKGSVVLGLDLVGPGGERLVEGRYPQYEKKPTIKSYPVPATGLYYLVARREGGVASGSYRLTAKVKQSKANKKGKGEFTGTEIPFEAVRGSTFKAALSGAGLTAAGVTLVGPEGEVPFVAKESNGKVAMLPVVLGAGTGTYTLRFATARTVAASWSLKLPKIKGAVAE